MNGTNEWAVDETDRDLFESWFEQGELGAVAEAAPHDEMRAGRSRLGVVIAAVSATALTLVIVFAGRL
ncbi:MAG TPA: hypothetical protein VKQ32_23785 [Polyangia bacterium]|nr:hypothetical protein [Polyangia bacterium]